MGTVAYRQLTAAETIFKNLIWTPMIMAGEVWIEGAVPFLALPVIKQIDEEAIKLLTDAIFNQFVLVTDITAIKLVNAVHQSAYNNAQEKLAVIADEQGVNSDAFKKEQDVALAALAKFSHIGS